MGQAHGRERSRMIRFIVGLLLTMGAVGGMDNPDQQEYFIWQTVAAFTGVLLMFWGTKGLNK